MRSARHSRAFGKFLQEILFKPCYVVIPQGERGNEATDCMTQGLIICDLFLPYI